MIDSLLAECASSGWLLNNLYQLDSGEWRANLRSADGRFTEFGKGDSAVEALERTMSLIANAEFSEGAYEEMVVHYAAKKQSLIDQLGLIKREPLRRI